MRQALILAGTRDGGDRLAAIAGVEHKALIEINGVTMLARVASALGRAGFDRITVSAGPGPVADAAVALNLRVIAAETSPSRSVLAALEALGPPLLVTTADHALLDPIWLDAFLAGVPERADMVALLARREQIERDMPGSRRTYLRFADGDWSGCNLFYLATQQARAALEVWQSIEADRKRPWRIVRRLGMRQLLRYVCGVLTLTEALAHLGRLANARVAIVESAFGLAAVDVDTADDLAAVRAIACPDGLDGTLFRLLEARSRIADAELDDQVASTDRRLGEWYRLIAVAETTISPEWLRNAAARDDPLATLELLSRGLTPDQPDAAR